MARRCSVIAELVRQADILGVTGREPFHSRPVHWLIELDEDGDALGLTPTAGANGKHGKRFSVALAYILGSLSQHTWKPDFLSGKAHEIFVNGINGDGDENKLQYKKKKNGTVKKVKIGPEITQFAYVVKVALRMLPRNKIIRAVNSFLENTKTLAEIPSAPTGDDLKCFEGVNAETLAFRITGKLALEDRELREWWETKKLVHLRRDEIKSFEQQITGGDAFQDGESILTEKSPNVFSTIPLVSFGSAPFVSYGLGKHTAKLRLDTAEKAAAALNAMLADDNAHLYLGDQVAVFWATQNEKACDCGFLSLIKADDPLAVTDYIHSVWGGRHREIDNAAFTLFLLEKKKGRFSVKSCASDSLARVDKNFRAYFEAIRLRSEKPLGISDLANCTIQPKSKNKPPSHVYSALLNTAWRKTPLPAALFKSAVLRQGIELAKGFDESDDKGLFNFNRRLQARTALMKLYFSTNTTRAQHDRENPMNDKNHDNQNHPAYLCGRVLAILDKIHNAAHNKSTASSPATRYYGSASSTPALVFPRLLELAAIHLEKIGGGLAHKLQNGVPKEKRNDDGGTDFDGLAQLIAKFAADAKWPRTLSLEDQGRFAIGFYYEKIRKWPKYIKGTNPVADEDDSE